MERQDQQLQQLTLTVNININDIRDLFSHLNGKPFHLSVSSESEATRLLPPMGYLLISIDNEELSILFWSIFNRATDISLSSLTKDSNIITYLWSTIFFTNDLEVGQNLLGKHSLR